MCQLGHNPQPVYQNGIGYSLKVNCTESLLQLILFLHVKLELGLNSVIISYAHYMDNV